MNLLTRQKKTHRLRKQTYSFWGEGKVREFGMVTYTLLYLKWITRNSAPGSLLYCSSHGSPFLLLKIQSSSGVAPKHDLTCTTLLWLTERSSNLLHLNIKCKQTHCPAIQTQLQYPLSKALPTRGLPSAQDTLEFWSIKEGLAVNLFHILDYT